MKRKRTPVKRTPKRTNFAGRFFPQNALATVGYYASPVQKVVKRWANEIGSHWCEHYAPSAYLSTMPGHSKIEIQLEAEGHRGCVLELLSAMHKVQTEREKPTPWLLDLSTGGESADYTPYSFADIQKKIVQRGGPKFAQNTLAQAAWALRLTGVSTH